MKTKNIPFLLIMLFLFSFTIIQAEEYIISIEEDSKEKNHERFSAKSSQQLNIDIDITRNFTTFNGFVANVSESEIKELEKNPNVKIEKNRVFHALLDGTIPIINANDTWVLSQNNTNITGLHQTVCVIDTGTNYSHTNLGGCYGNNSADSNCTVIGGWDFVNNDYDPMDDNGHGTHVAGIVTSNHTTYNGVAPDVKIISIKVLNENGTGDTSDIASAIDWCVNNATIFNISVITMSLGSINTFENSYCDSDWSLSLTPAIRAANVNNITVLASAGNCENGAGDYTAALCDTGITAPACIQGAIPVGAVDNSDDIDYQRGALFEILAPGVSIASTSYTGGFEGRSGTSMSAPHVAGAVALLSQFYKLQINKSFTNTTIINALNNTNTFIDDTANSGYNFPRLDILRSLFFLDLFSPTITLLSPANNTVNTSTTQNFSANLTDFNLQNITFYLYNSTGVENITSKNVTGQSSEFQIKIINLSQNETTTTINYPNNNNATNVNETNFSCTTKASVYKWSITAQDKNNNVVSSQNNTLIINNSGTNLSNITFSLYNNTSLVYNETTQISGDANTSIFNFTFSDELSYSWNCSTRDNNSQMFNSQTYAITYDITNPNVTTVSPLPTSETSDSTQKIFYFNVSDANNLSCSLLFDNVTQETKTISNTTGTQNFTRTLAPGTYNWKINCTDVASNTNTSAENSFTITAEPVVESSSGGGGGGGGGDSSPVIGSVNNPVSKDKISDGYETNLIKNERVYFTNANNDNHSVKLNEIINNSVNITIQSDPINVLIKENESLKLNTTSKEYLDLEITVKDILFSSVDIEIKEINETNPNYNKVIEEINEEPQFHTMNDTNNSTEIQRSNDKGNEINAKHIGIIIIMVIIIGITFVIVNKPHKKKKHIKAVSIKHIKKEKNKK